jgi:hypothetical protein
VRGARIPATLEPAAVTLARADRAMDACMPPGWREATALLHEYLAWRVERDLNPNAQFNRIEDAFERAWFAADLPAISLDTPTLPGGGPEGD